MSSNDEIERLKRLRDRQLSMRDPNAKEKKTHRKIAMQGARYKQRTKITPQSVLAEIPNKWLGIVFGAALGTVISLGLPLFIPASWVELLWLPIILILSIVGFIVGQGFDMRDELRDL